MKRTIFLLLLLLFAGCQGLNQPVTQEPTEPSLTIEDLPSEPRIFYPIEDYAERLTFKVFNQEVHDRFQGWHVGDDLEVQDQERDQDIPVYAMADGEVLYRNWIGGYGGVLVLEHFIDGQKLQSLYGHIDLSKTTVGLGEQVKAGTLLTYLAPDQSYASDYERKHLHFGLYAGTTLKLQGYVPRPNEVEEWINPSSYLKNHQALDPTREVTFPDDWKDFSLQSLSEDYPFILKLPQDWSASFISESASVALFAQPEPGELDTAQVFIRFFDAADFLTLSTVTIHSRERATINGHETIVYDIEKKPAVADFPFQPAWRNLRHEVTDIRANDGFSRFFVFAKHPELDEKLFYYLMRSMEIGNQGDKDSGRRGDEG